ncbi:YppF family protein [Neobacillus niacini]|uniref:YppF family protein n=1 Tax=Neobacillus niacini TaxID=86668 RepID=UPI0021CB5B34|nr:YppF family protein [Neobacillus niacini]MCM3766605.1 YppF family protein [Neobacillus niacini]
MDIRELKSRFNQSRDYSTDDVNALMDFVKKAYIYNEISIIDYRNLVRELEKLGAVVPEEPIHSLIEIQD